MTDTVVLLGTTVLLLEINLEILKVIFKSGVQGLRASNMAIRVWFTQSPLYSFHMFKQLFHTLLYNALKSRRVMRGEGMQCINEESRITYSHDQQQFNVRINKTLIHFQ